MKTAALVASLAALALAGGCGQEKSYTVTDPKTGEKSKVSVSEDGGEKRVTVKTEDGSGSVVIGEGAPPKNLPAWVPTYPGAKYEASFSGSDLKKSGADGPAAGGMMMFTTKDAPQKVVDHYAEAFKKAGLAERGRGNFGEMAMVSASKGEGEAEGAQVMAAQAEGGGSSVQVIWSLGQ